MNFLGDVWDIVALGFDGTELWCDCTENTITFEFSDSATLLTFMENCFRLPPEFVVTYSEHTKRLPHWKGVIGVIARISKR